MKLITLMVIMGILLVSFVSATFIGSNINVDSYINSTKLLVRDSLISFGNSYTPILNDWQLNATNGHFYIQKFNGTGWDNQLDLGASGTLSTLIIKGPNANIVLLDSDGTKRNMVSDDVDDSDINVGNFAEELNFNTNSTIRHGVIDPDSPVQVIVQPIKNETIYTDEIEFFAVSYPLNDGSITSSHIYSFNNIGNNVTMQFTTFDNGRAIYQNVNDVDFSFGEGDLIGNDGRVNFSTPLFVYSNRTIRSVFKFSENVSINGTYVNGTFYPYIEAIGKGINFKQVNSYYNWRNDINYTKGQIILENGTMYHALVAGNQSGNFTHNRNDWKDMTGGSIIGEFYAQDNSVATNISIKNMWYNVTVLTCGYNNQIDCNNSKLTILSNGAYSIDYGISFSDGNIQEFEFAIGKNGQYTNKCKSERKLGSNDKGNVGTTCILELTKRDEITLMTRNINSTSDPTIINAGVVVKWEGY